MQDVIKKFRALSDQTRLRIFLLLAKGELCVCELKDVLGMEQSRISHNLRILKEAGLVRAERDPSDARWIYYQIEPEALAELRSALAAALDPARLKPRGEMCGPPGCCPPAISAS